MAYEIRALSFTEILDRAFRVLLDNFVLFFGISAVVFVPMGILQAVAGKTQVFGTILGLFVMVTYLFFHAALLIGMIGIYLDRQTSVVDAYRSAKPVMLRFMGTYLLMATPVFLAVIPMTIMVLMRVRIKGPFPIFLMILATGSLFFYFMIRWVLAGPIMIAERRFGPSALRRSSELIRGQWWRTFGIIIASALIVQVPVAVLNLLWSSIPFLGPILTSLVQAATAAYAVIVMVLYYFDRRCRIENFDLHYLVEQVRAEGAIAPVTIGASTIA